MDGTLMSCHPHRVPSAEQLLLKYTRLFVQQLLGGCHSHPSASCIEYRGLQPRAHVPQHACAGLQHCARVGRSALPQAFSCVVMSQRAPASHGTAPPCRSTLMRAKLRAPVPHHALAGCSTAPPCRSTLSRTAAPLSCAETRSRKSRRAALSCRSTLSRAAAPRSRDLMRGPEP